MSKKKIDAVDIDQTPVTPRRKYARKISFDSSKTLKKDKTIELIQDIISQVSPSKIIEDILEPQSSNKMLKSGKAKKKLSKRKNLTENDIDIEERENYEFIPNDWNFGNEMIQNLSGRRKIKNKADGVNKKKRGRKSLETSQSQKGKKKKVVVVRREEEGGQSVSKERDMIKIEEEETALCIKREEFEKRSQPDVFQDILNRQQTDWRKCKYKMSTGSRSFSTSPFKEISISATVPIIDSEGEEEREDFEYEPYKKMRVSISNWSEGVWVDPVTVSTEDQVSNDMQKEFGNTLTELGERLKNFSSLGSSMKTLSFLQQKNKETMSISKDEQNEPMEILTDFYLKVKKLYLEFGQNLNQTR